LQPIFFGALTVAMAPEAFIQEPYRWLKAITDFRGSVTVAPNFAYELCCSKSRGDKDETLDLSCWRIAGSGGEPPRAATLERFARRFAPRGFQRTAFYPSYGMAETTLQVTNGRVGVSPRVAEFEAIGAVGCRTQAVSNGAALDGHDIRIVDPDCSRVLPAGAVGEVWVSGPTVAHGYWGRPEQSTTTFGARLTDSSQSKANGRYSKADFRYDAQQNEYICPAGQRLTYRFDSVEHDKRLWVYETNQCTSCPLQKKCTTSHAKRIKRWEKEDILDAADALLKQNPDAMRQRKRLVEHPYGTIKHWMGSTHFLMKRLPNVQAEMSLHVLAYNLKRAINVLGVAKIMEQLQAA
jgi:acyl-CoA synthetase (AMP-forming)/AMP-acid ligase II